MEPFNAEVLLIAAVIVVSALLSGFVEKSGLPQVAIFLALGAFLGPHGLNLVDARIDSSILRVVASLSLVLVLFTDALSLNVAEVRRQPLLAALVVGPGTLLSAVLMALLSAALLGLSLPQAAILGAALASTDPVLLRDLLRKAGLHQGVRQALRLEGGMNDSVLLPIVLIAISMITSRGSLHGVEWASLLLNILVLSPAAGVLVGLAGVGLLQLVRRRMGIRRDFESIYSLGIALAAFAAAQSVHGSGYVAAFAAGITISALDVELCDCFLEYGETTAEMALMFTFVLFGTSLIWSGLSVLNRTTLLFTAAVFAARMVAFIPALLPARLTWPDRLMIAWFGPRGLSSLLLVLLPVFAGSAGTQELVRVCSLVVLFSIVVHGLTPLVFVRNRRAAAMAASSSPAPAAVQDSPPEPGAASPTHDAAGQQALIDPEYISIEELTKLRSRSAPVIVIDARSERSYEESSETIPGSIRLHPDEAVRAAARWGIRKQSLLAVLCA